MISNLMDNNFLGSMQIRGNPLSFLLMNRNILLNNISQWELLFPKHFHVYENVRRRSIIEVSKTPDSSSAQLKKWTHLKCWLYLLFFHQETRASSSVFTLKLSLQDQLRKNYNWSDLWNIIDLFIHYHYWDF